MNWLPDNEAVTTAENSLAYEIKITGTANGQSDDEIFVITVNNVDRPPVLGAISNETVNETVAFTTVNAGDTTNGDLDRDLDVITYSCYFDTTVSTTVADTTECTGLPGGASFNTSTGVLDWTPGYDVVTTAEVSNDYEIKITGTANGASDEKIFVFTVNNVNRPLILGTISDETVNENVAITQVNAGDTTNGDSDRDDDVITFSCYFDTTVGGGVDNTNDCSTLPGGGSFDTATGILKLDTK